MHSKALALLREYVPPSPFPYSQKYTNGRDDQALGERKQPAG